jgi:AraC-like DNA-binding protein
MENEQNNNKLQVQHFAERLNLHPNYLNSVIKSKTGKTINEWIVVRTLSISRSLLKNTELSVKEIGYRLGFSEPTHFNRFFKKHQNTTPVEYRKSLHSLK